MMKNSWNVAKPSSTPNRHLIWIRLSLSEFRKKIRLTTDASNCAIGAVLRICYASRSLNSCQINFSVIEKKLFFQRLFCLKEPLNIETDFETVHPSVEDPFREITEKSFNIYKKQIFTITEISATQARKEENIWIY